MVVDPVFGLIICPDGEHLKQGAQHREVRGGGGHRGRDVQYAHRHHQTGGRRPQRAAADPKDAAAAALPDSRLDSVVQLGGDGGGVILRFQFLELLHGSYTPSNETRSFFRPVYSRVLTVLRGAPVTALISFRESSS